MSHRPNPRNPRRSNLGAPFLSFIPDEIYFDVTAPLFAQSCQDVLLLMISFDV